MEVSNIWVSICLFTFGCWDNITCNVAEMKARVKRSIALLQTHQWKKELFPLK